MKNSFIKSTAVLLTGAALSLALVACGPHPSAEDQSRLQGFGIVHGKSVKSTDELAQFVVALVAENQEGQALCTGTLISENVVLTAAHCVEGQPEKLVVVFGPRVQSAKAENMRNVDTYVQNPKWGHADEEGQGDLALVHFEGDLPSGFAPVRLAKKSLKLPQGTDVVMIGYGVTDGNRQKGAGVLRETETTVMGEHSPTEMMTDGHQNSVCFGDSGGPAFVKQGDSYVQWGVANSVVNQACNEASIHTLVMPYETWIRAGMRKMQKGSESGTAKTPRQHRKKATDE